MCVFFVCLYCPTNAHLYLKHYAAQQIFESNGYDDIDVLVGISDEDLLELNITDATHRAALVKVCA